ncbi:Modification methylase FokI [anaerobic digester metagenome]
MRQTIKKFGLEKADSESYLAARQHYNLLPKEKRDPRLLFTIILYGYQQQIRFNSNHDFNNPVGMRWFNDKVLEKMISFSRVIKENDFKFLSCNYVELSDEIDSNTFVYLDPPYKMTIGSYNDGKRGFNGWNEVLEQELFLFLDELSKRSVPFMLSYVLEHKGKKNHELEEWIKKNDYKLIPLGDILGISGSRRKEVLIVNYEK